MEEILNKGPTVLRRFLTILAVMLVLALPSFMLFTQQAQATGTAAGTSIGNQATATYEDGGGIVYTSTSNFITTTISKVYNFTLTPNSTDQSTDLLAQGSPGVGMAQNATPGGIVYYTYTLQNNGNTSDNFTIQALVGAGAGSRFTPSDLKVYLDTGDGIPQEAEKIATGSATATVGPVAADTTKTLLVAYQVPGGASLNQFAAVDLTADSDGGTALPPDVRNYNRTTVVNDAVVSFLKSVDKLTADPSNVLTYTIDIKNNGNLTAENVVVEDLIPTGTAFKLLTASTGTQTSSGSQGTFTTLGAADAVLSPQFRDDGAGGDLVAGDLIDNRVLKLKYELDPIIAAQSVQITFKVQINASATPGTIIPNNAVTAYDTVSNGTVNDTTNTVNTAINLKSAVVITPNDPATPPQVLSGTNEDNDTLTLASTSAGSTVIFPHYVTNNGTGTDTFDLSNSALPGGWTIAYTDTSNNPLPNANANAYPDITLAAGASGNIWIKISIPTNTGVSGSTTITTTATSTNGGVAVGTNPGQQVTNTTRDIISAILAANVDILNVISGVATNTEPVILTASSNGTTVSYPLNVLNTGGQTDTFNLTASTLPAGMSVQYFSVPLSTTMSVATSSSVTLVSATGIAVGNTIVVNGQSLTVTGVSGVGPYVVSFGPDLLVDTSIANSTVVKVGAPISSVTLTANPLPLSNTNVVAVVTVAKGTVPNGAGEQISFKATSTNDSNESDIINDTIVIPEFRTFSLGNNGDGTVPRGGVIFYDHTITNTGNVSERFLITNSALGTNGLSYQLLDSHGVPQANSYTIALLDAIPVNGTYLFQVKVTVPPGQPIPTTEFQDVTINETVATINDTAFNTDKTTVIEGLINLTKTVFNVSQSVPGVNAVPGNILEYTIAFANVGATNAIKVKISDIIPANTTYVPGSLKINTLAKTDAQDAYDTTQPPNDGELNTNGTTSDQFADFNVSAPNTVTFYVGTGASPTLGGTVLSGIPGNGTVSFQVTVN